MPDDEEDQPLKGYEQTHGEGAEATLVFVPVDDDEDPPRPTISSVTKEALELVIRRASCVVSTCVSSEVPFIVQNFQPKVVFVDEAATARLSEVCLTIVGPLERKELAIACLVGDSQQPRPLVITKYEKAPGSDKAMNPMAEQLETSPTAQLEDENYPRDLFLDQSRMVTDLKSFSNEQFYHGRLRDSPETALARRAIAQNAILYFTTTLATSLKPFLFVNVSGGVTTATGLQSRQNPYDVVITLGFVKGIVEAGVCRYQDITTLTPYNGQRRAYTRAIDQTEKLAILSARTIDSFQGAVVARTRKRKPASFSTNESCTSR